MRWEVVGEGPGGDSKARRGLSTAAGWGRPSPLGAGGLSKPSAAGCEAGEAAIYISALTGRAWRPWGSVLLSLGQLVPSLVSAGPLLTSQDCGKNELQRCCEGPGLPLRWQLSSPSTTLSKTPRGGWLYNTSNTHVLQDPRCTKVQEDWLAPRFPINCLETASQRREQISREPQTQMHKRFTLRSIKKNCSGSSKTNPTPLTDPTGLNEWLSLYPTY